jgi:signal transduction histidine kinase/ActR/RegA family two-component response regulator
VQLALTTQRDERGELRRLIGVAEDITEHLQLEASERAREQAEAASRAKTEFVGRMSHELRTPLNAVLGFAQLLGRDTQSPLSEHQQRWAGQIQDAGWHLLNLINDTLDLSMIESGSLRLTPSALDPLALLEATLPLVASAAERRRVEVSAPVVQPDTGMLRGDETRVLQILTNLLSNAVKYNLPEGRVDVQVRRLAATEEVEFEVRDTGLGLSAAQAQSLFEPFNRLGRESGHVEGTGIGLVISRRLAEMMGGSLSLRATEGQGATFVLRLPAVPPPAGGRAAPLQRPSSAGAYRRRTVHYIEDNETNIVVMQGMLAERPQIDLTVSRLGLEALATLRRRRPDLILLDMHLPDIDGLDLLRELKQADGTASIPILVLSADATRDRVERAMAEGARGYLSKPLDLQELLSAVDDLLEQADSRWG